ncbi:Ig-like domain-containing protein [Pseudomonas sp. NPDC007930]|uniref:Ig-like domain-containing protein n=1 Tax=Pseudomonas sp. NPDC007930 TaxID=3364417 RepID=UPI0036EC93B9
MKRSRTASIRLALEARLMFDGAAVATAEATVANHPANTAAAADAHAAAPDHQADAAHTSDASHDAALHHALTATDPGHSDAPSAARQEIYFIDSSLPDRDTLAAALPVGAQVVWLNDNENGLTQIEQALQGRSGIDAIHIITHANEGDLQLGNIDLTTASIQGQYADALHDIGTHLSANADVLIYGCNFAEGSVGDAAVHALASALSADVAASTNTTGVSGDWVLEDQTGHIEATTLVAAAWQHDLLAVANGDTATTNEDTAVTINVLANDTGLGTLSVTSASALHGTVVINANNTLTYTPTANYNGGDTITYGLRDSTGNALLPGLVAVTVNPVNDAPVVSLPSLGGQTEDIAVTFSSLLGRPITISDVDNTTTTVTLTVPQGSLSLGALGLVSITAGANNSSSITISGNIALVNLALDGLTYTPVADYNGPVNLSVTANDGALASTATLPMNFAAVPDIVADSATTPLNTPVSFNVMANDNFENSGARVTAHSNPLHGTVTIDALGNTVYTPTTGYSGSDSFTYTVTSGGVTETATVTVTTYIPNYAPTIAAPSTTVNFNEDTPVVFSTTNGNAISVNDANGDTLTVTLTANHGTLNLAQTSGLTLLSGTGLGDSLVTMRGSIAAINAALQGMKFTPVADYNGSAGIAISANDGQVTTTSSVAMNIAAVTDGVPDAVSTSLALPVTFSPLANDTFASTAVISGVTQGAHGLVVVGLNNQVTYTPALGYTGTDSFTYTVLSGGVTETVSVSVTVGDHAPTSTSLGSMSTLDGAIVLQPTAGAFHDADVLDLLTYSASNLPQGLSIDPLTGIISGVVNTHASVSNGSGGGTYNVVVTATDLAGQSASSTLAVTVINPPPIPLVGLVLGGNENSPLHINVSALAIVDPDGDTVTVTGATALHGTVTVGSDGSLNYVPNTSYNGLDTITYTVRDADGGTATGYALVTLAALPHLPGLSLPTIPLLTEDTPLIFANLLGQQLSVGDIDGNVLSLSLNVPIGALSLSESAGVTLTQGTGNMDQVVTITGTAANITAALAHLIYTPAADYNGLVTIGIDLGQLTGGLLHVTAQLPITIAPVADINDDYVSATLNTPANFNVLANDTFEYAGRYVSSFTQPAHGTVTLDAQGNAVYTPTSGYLGADTFTYTVTSDGTTETATVHINTALPNYPPTISAPTTQTSAEDATLVFSSGNGNALSVADANNDTLSVTVSASHGTFNLGSTSGVTLVNGTGSGDTSVTLQGSAAAINAALQGASFHPVPDYNGTATVAISANDGQATTTSSVALTITPVADGVPDTISTGPLQPVSFYPMANDTFAAGASISAFSQGAHGTVVLGLNGQMVYTPALGYLGNDSFTYTVTSGGVTETVSVNVIVGDHAPTSTGLVNVTTVDGGLVALAAGLAFHDSDALDVLRFSASGLPAGLSIDPLTGTINGIVNTHASVGNGSGGGTYNVLVTATDLAGQSVTSNFQLTVLNPAPIPLVGVSVAGVENNPLNIGVNALGIVDPDGDPVTVTGATALHGTVTIAANGDLVYTPNTNYYGIDTITYTARDSDGGTATGYVAVVLTQVYQAPVISLPALPLLTEDTPLLFANILGQQLNVGNVDGGIVDVRLSVPIGGFTLAEHGGVSIAEGTGTMDQVLVLRGTVVDINAALAKLVYTPGADYNGNLNITLDVSQLTGGLLHVQAILPITIVPVADIVDDHVSVTENTSASFNVLANDTFEYAGRYVSSHTDPAHGTVTLDAQGNMIYTPAAGYLGNDSFTYTVTSDGTTETATVYLTVAQAPNHDPVGQPIGAQQGVDGSPFNLAVASRFSDADGDTLAYSATGLPAGLSINSQTGLISGTLDGHASTAVTNGVYTVVVSAADGHGGMASQSFTLTVSNPPPVAANATFNGSEDVAISGTLQATDPDGDAIAFSVASAPAHGSVSIASNGTFTYTPAPNYNGDDSFTYQVRDSDGGVATATVMIHLAAVNDPPVATGSIAAQASSDGAAFTLGTAGNFTDVDGDTLTYSASNLPAGLSINAQTGVISGTLDGHASQGGSGATGQYAVVVTATDPSGTSASQSFTLTVTNPPPVTASVTLQATEDTPYSGTLQATDPDGDAIAFSTVTAPAHGSLSLAANGSFTYTPNANYNGTDSFTYQVRDADGGIATATVTLNIAAVNDAPSATPIPAQSANDSTAVNLPAGNFFSDVDGDTLSYSASGLPSGLVINAQTGLISGTLGSSASTQSPTGDGHYNVTVTANDGHGGVTSQTFSFDVSNPAPTTAGGSFTLNEDTPLSATLSATDADGDALSFSATSQPAHGSVVVNANGTFTYTPAANYNGSDSFTYQVRDADGGIATGTVTLSITPVNDAPTVTSQIATQAALDSGAFSLNLAGRFSDVDGDSLTYSASGLPAGLSVNPQTGLLSGVLGSSASQGGANADGHYSITVSADDGHGGTVSQTFTLVVSNPPPVTSDASYALDQGGSVSGVLAASDPDGDSIAFTATSQPAHGSLTLGSNGSFVYTPVAGFNGQDSFTYQVRDADGGLANATVTFNVAAVNHPPVVDSPVGTQQATDSGAVHVEVASHFSDPDGGALTYSASGLPNGVSIDPASGLISGALAHNASTGGSQGNGQYTVVVTATDAQGASVSLTFVLVATNPAPITADTTFPGTEDTVLTGNLVASDPDGDPISFSATSQPAHGTLVVNPNGSFSYTPNANYNGTDSFTYQVRDSDGGIATATATLVIAAVNDAPTATGTLGTQTAADGSNVHVNLAGYFTDVDGDTLTYSTSSSLPLGLTLNPNTGVIGGVLDGHASVGGPGLDGQYSITVTADDGHGGSVSQTFTFVATNPAPTTSGQTLSGTEDTPLQGTLTATDPDGDALSFSVPTGPAHGTLTLDAATGVFTYTPAANFNGTDSFTYQVTDADGGISTAQVVLNIAAVNDAPVASSPLTQVNANDSAVIALNLGSHFTDVDGDTLTYTVGNLPAGLSYDPATGLVSGQLGSSASQGGPNNDGHYSISVSVSDGQGGVLNQSFELVISNPAPVSPDSTITLTQGTSASGTLVGYDPDGDAITFSVATGPAHGTLVLSGNGDYTYTPDASFSGADTFTYRVTDADGAFTGANVVVTILADTGGPAIASQIGTQTAADGTMLNLDLASHFSDGNGDTLTYTSTGTLPAGITLDPQTGLFSGQLGSSASQGGDNHDGRYTITVTAADDHGGSVSQTFILVTNNPAPLAGNANYTLAEDGALSAQLQGSDPDGDAITFSATQLPAHGTLTLNPDGSFLYLPAADYNGTDSFTYQVRDADGAVATAVVTLMITPVNDAPVVSNPVGTQTYNDSSVVSLNVGASFSDVDHDTLTYSTSSTLPPGLSFDSSSGVLSGTLGSSASTGGPNGNGQYSITVTADDGHGGSVSQSFTFVAVNTVPVTTGITLNGTEDTPLQGSVSASDADHDALTFSVTAQPAHGTLVFAADGSFTYTPAANFNGTDSFTYQVADPDGGVASATVTLAIAAVNDAPVLSSPIGTTSAADSSVVNLNLASHFTDVDGDTLSYSTSSTLPPGLTLSSTGLISGTLGSSASQGGDNHDGHYTITVSVSDNHGGVVQQDVLIIATNPLPVAANATFSGSEDAPVSGQLSGSDPDGDSISFAAATQPAHGTVTVDANTGAFVYTPAANFNGQDSFSYSVTDADGGVTTAVITLNIAPVNDAPVVSNPLPTQAAQDAGSVGINVAASFSDVDGDTLTYSLGNGVTLPSGLTLNPQTGLISGTLSNSASAGGPNNDGHYSISVVASDGHGGSATETFELVVSNPPPLASNQNVSTQENVAVSGTLQASDPDGDALSFSVTTAPGHGSVAINPDGTFSYTPGAGYSGADSFSYQVRDAQGATATATVSISVAAVNDAPVLSSPFTPTSLNDGSTVNLDIAGHFSDQDGDTLTYSAVGLPAGLSITPAGLITGTLGSSASQGGANHDGNYQVTLTVSDGHGGTLVQAFTLVAVNTLPTAATANFSGSEDSPITGNLAPSAQDADGDTLTFSAASQPAHGSVVVNPNGTFTYLPNTDYNGSDSFTYQVRDADGAVTTALVNLTIAPVNDAPTLLSPVGTQQGNDASAVSVDVAAHFRDADQDTLHFSTSSTLPPGLSLSDSGVLSGVLDGHASVGGPNNDGHYSITVVASDGTTTTSTTFVFVALNPAPTAPGDSFSGPQNTPISGQLPASDADGDALHFSTATPPANGSVVVNDDGSFTYTPAAGFHGSDSFSYRVTDADGGTTTAVVTLTIDAVNSAPTLSSPVGTVNAVDGGNLSVALGSHFSDADGDTLTYSTSSTLPLGVTLNAQTGLLSGILDGHASRGGDSANGQYSITVVASDGHGGSVSETFLLVASNPAPVSADSSVTLQANSSFTGTLQASDPDGDPISFSIGTGPSHGSVAISPGGSYTYTPLNGYTGSDSFTYQVTDSDGGSVTATVTLNITAQGNHAPQVIPLPAQTASDGQAFALNGAAGFSDSDGDTLTYSLGSGSTLPAGLTLNAQTGLISGQIDGHASAQHGGVYSVVLVASDGTTTASQTLTFTISNPPPVSADSNLAVNENASASGTLIANDPDGDTLTFTRESGPAHGTLVLNPNGTYQYTPTANFYGSDSFSYRVTDADGGFTTAVVSITVNEVNQPPQVTSSIGTQTGADGTAVSFSVAGNFSDPEGHALSYSAAGLPAGVSIDAQTGLISGTLGGHASVGGPGNLGQYSVTVTANDGQGGSVSQSFTLVATNPPPQASALGFSGSEDTPLQGTLTASDPDGDTITFSAATQPAHGSVVVNPNGSFTYTPNANFNGTDTFTYQVTDADGGIATAQATLTIAAVNDAPAVTSPVGTQQANDGAPVNLSVASHFSDVDGDTLHYTASGLPAGLAISDDGTISGTLGTHASVGGPAGNGQYSVTVTASDGHGGTVSQTFTLVAINPPPVVANVSFNGSEDTPLAGTLTATDPDGDAMTFSVASGPAHGSVTLNPDGTFSYQPAANFNGSDTFVYQVRDADGGLATAVVTLNIAALNDAPIVTSPIATQQGSDGAPVNITLAGHFADADGDSLTYSSSALPTGLVLNAQTGVISGTLDSHASVGGSNQDGRYLITVSVSDGHGGSVSQSFVFEASNPPPQTSDRQITVQAGSTYNGALLATDPDGDALSFSLSSPAAHGSVAVGPNGQFSYTPATGFTGSDSFTYQVRDADGGLASATITFNVSAQPDQAPAVVQLAAQSGQDGAPFTLNAGAGFSDAEGDTLIFSASGLPAGLSINAQTGVISGTLDGHASVPNGGHYDVLISANDGNFSVSQTVSFTITNPPPLVADSTLVVAANTPAGGLLQATDPDGDSISFSVASGPSHGNLALGPNGSYVYTPANGYTGSDSFSYRVTDADGGFSIAVVSISVGTNQAPVSTSPVGTVVANDGASVSLPAAGHFSDPEGGALTYSASGLPAGLSIDAQSGLISGSLGGHASVGGPAGNGQYSVTLTATDSGGASVSQTFTLVANNPPPVTADTSLAILAGASSSGVLLASDPDGDAITFFVGAAPNHGTLTLAANGSYTYTPANGFTGADSFTYSVRDADGGIATATVQITVASVLPPVVTGPVGTQGANDGSPVNIDTGSHFSSPMGDPLTYTASGLPPGLSINPSTGVISGTLPSNASSQANGGNYTVSVIATDGHSGSASQSFTLHVSNPAPEAADSTLNANGGVPLVGTLPGRDPDGDALTFTRISSPAHGTLVLNANGSFSYTPDTNYQGSDTFTYQVRDSDGGVAIATVTINVSAQVDRPFMDAESTLGVQPDAVDHAVLIFHRDANYTPVLLDAVNGVKRLEGLNVLTGNAPMEQVADAMGDLADHAEIAADASPMASAVGDMNAASRTPLDVDSLREGPFGTQLQAAPQAPAPAADTQAAPEPATPEQAQAPTFDQQVQFAAQQRQAEMDALMKMLRG